MKRRRSPSTSRIPASSAPASPASARRPTAASTRSMVGLASEATTRATSSAGAPSRSGAPARAPPGRPRSAAPRPGRVGRRAARARSRARERRTDSRPRPPRHAGASAAGERAPTRSQQLVERTDAERPERDRHEPLFRNASSHPGGNLVARRQDRCHRLQLETSHREAKHRHRRRIEPLHVVDGEHDPLVGGKHSQGVQEGEGDDALVRRRPLGVRERERGLERPSLRPWKLRQDLADILADQVGQTDKREPGLGFGGAARKHPVAARLRSLGGCRRQCRLADTGLADDDGGGKEVGGRVRRSRRAASSSSLPDEMPNADRHWRCQQKSTTVGVRHPPRLPYGGAPVPRHDLRLPDERS